MYQVSDHTRSQFEKMLGLTSVKEALAFIEANQPEAIEEQKELVLIEAPTGHEENRAKVFAEKFKALGLEDVHTDRGGNVIGIRRGTGKGPKVLIEGHMDTVFPFGTVKGVEEKDGFLYAPGIGDDTRALAMLLCLIRTLNKTGIQTAGDIVFVGTTREEGMGGLGGMKDFLADNDDIDISLSLDNNDMSLLVFEATGGETYEVTFTESAAMPLAASERWPSRSMQLQEQWQRSLILWFRRILRPASVCQTSMAETTQASMRSRPRPRSNSTSGPIPRRSWRN